MKQLIKRLSSVPPHVAIILVLAGIIGASGAILLLKHTETKVEALAKPRAARLERLDGDVDIAQALNQADNDQLSWTDAQVNAPLTVGDRVWARGVSHAQIALTGRNYVRLNPDTALDVLSLADQRTQLALRSGSAVFDVGELTNGELYEVATPCGAVDFSEPGLYQLGIGDDGNTTVSVLNGLAQVVGLAGSGVINKGEILTLASQVAAQALVSHIAPETAGNILNDYYGYRYPNRYDGRYRNYDTYLDDPDYYDPYSRSVSYQYVTEEVPGLYDLDEYGDWQDVDGYGRCWAPRVAADWSPYRQGYWDVNDVWGPTWVSSEPWGYAPYHYGRWAYVNQQRWMWVPEGCRTEAVYAPALVAFVPIQQSQVAWVPLAPGEPYVSRYYDASFAPQYLASPQVVEQVVVQRNYVNMTYPTAVTVVPVQSFTQPINQSVIVQTNPQWLQQAQPVIDPYQIAGLRQVALQEERAQRKQARREVAAAMFNRPVVTSVAPVVPPVRGDAAQALQYQPVPEKQKRNKLQFENSGQVVMAQRADGVPLAGAQASQQVAAQQRDQRIAQLRARMEQGDRSAKQELRQLKQERRQQPAFAQAQPVAPSQQAAQQAPQQAMTPKQQRRFERQQQMAAQQQQAASQSAQVNQQREQRRAQKQAARQQAMQQQAPPQQVESRRQQKPWARQQQAQQVQQQAAQQQTQRAQMKAQRRAERQQQQQQQVVVQQQRSQMKQQRRAERQQQQAAPQQQWQAAQQQAQHAQMKAQRRAERQQQVVQQPQWQQPAQQQQMRQQMKQQRRFERQQQAAPQAQVYQAPAYRAPAAQPSKAERKAARRNQQ